MPGRFQKFVRGLLLVALLAGYLIAIPFERQFAFASSPAAGTCSDSSGELICNVSEEHLDFSRASLPESKTQTASSTTKDIGVGLAQGTVIRYENVFTGDDGTVVDALVTIDSLPVGAGESTYIFDQDRADSDGIKPIDMSNLQGTLSVTVSFVNDDDESIKLQNMQVITKDLDVAAGESAEYSGLVSYSLSSGSYIQVDDSVAGVRRFTSNTEVGLSDPKGWVSVTFPTTSTVGLTANISTTSRSIPFDFDSRAASSSSLTATTAVAAASYEVSFDLDGGSGDLPSAVSGTGALTFPSAGGQSKNGISISGWSASSGGVGARVALGGTYTPISDTTFYAVYGGASVGPPSGTSGTVGQAFSSTVTTSGFASSDLTFTIGSGALPAGLALNSSTGAVAGTPTVAGNQSITVTATHSAGGSATSSSFTLAVAKGSQSISWSPTTALALGDSGLTLSATRTVGDGTLGYSVVSQGTTGCSTSGATLTFTSTGTGSDGCEVRPTLTGTSNYNEKTDASTVIFNVTASTSEVSFNANGGSGSMSNQTVNSGVATAINANSFTRSGRSFIGWNTAADGSGAAYSNGANITTSSAVTLFAQWTGVPSSGGSSSSGSSSSSAMSVPAPVSPAATPPATPLAAIGPNTDPVTTPVERLGLAFDPDAASRATIGDVMANLLKTPLGPSALSLAAGAFEFGVRLNEGVGAEVQTNTPSDSPELFVPRGDTAEVSGKGSYPGSFVQVWLPREGDDSRELARIPVSSDGTFASILSFSAGALELPVPIGRQMMQVVGYDEQGNQTVVDMTINIGQGVPAPEPNRQVGALPDLSAGESLATSGGVPETVSVTGVPETGSVVVEGNAWVISVSTDSVTGAVENTDGGVLMRLTPSSVGQWSGSGFMPGTLATVWLFSEPTRMTTVTIDENGEFSSEFLVDARLIAPGEHTLQVQGVGADGFIKAANLGVLVEQPLELTTESASGLLWWVAGGFLLLLLVVLFVIVARRRRAE